MIKSDAVKSRMETGMTFLEFSYALMQSFDFLHLFKTKKCIIEAGSQDQWFNIISGIDLIHKKENKEVFGITFPLLLDSDGNKIGKSQGNPIWLDPNKTSPFDFFQFWRNVPDEMVKSLFLMFTFLSVDSINSMDFGDINARKKHLAFLMTEIVHGTEVASKTQAQVELLFENKGKTNLEAIKFQDNISIVDIMVSCNLAKSKSDARNLISGKGISISNNIIQDFSKLISIQEFGEDIIIRKGKKTFVRVILEKKE